MIKKIELLGTKIDNYSVKESMLLVETYLNNNVMNTIESVSMKMLVQAEENENLKQTIESLDLAMPGERDILLAAGIKSAQRMKEVSDNAFFMEFAKRIVRNHKKVCLLGETRDRLNHLLDFITQYYERMNIVGCLTLEECSGDIAGTINEINILAPDIILSVLPTPTQEEFLAEQLGKLDAKLWYGLGDNYMKRNGFSRVTDGFHKIVGKAVFHSKLTKYKQEE